MSTRLVLHTGSDPADVGTARTFVAAIARTAGLDDESIDHLRMAISEVASAVVEFEMGPIDITVEVGEQELTMDTRTSVADERLEARLVLVTRLPLRMSVDGSAVRLTFPFPSPEA